MDLTETVHAAGACLNTKLKKLLANSMLEVDAMRTHA